jgi:hypothetical protein
MKTKLFALAALSVAALNSNAAVSISGTALSGIGALNAPAGSLILFLLDNDDNGFLSSNIGGSGTLGNSNVLGDLTVTDDPKLAAQSVALNGTFGGDLILGRMTVSSAGSLVGGLGIATTDPTSFENLAATQGKSWALVWLPGLTLASTTAAGGQTYGIVSGSDWTLPATNANSLTYNTTLTDAVNPLRVTVAAGVATNDRFTTSGGATFAIIPEPSAALLGAIGALGLLRRRRI